MVESMRRLAIPRSRAGLAQLFARALSLFTLQGAGVLLAYALGGPAMTSGDLPPGMQLDPRHAVLHLVIGLAAAFVAFRRPEWSVGLTRAFALVYLGLAVLGTFTTMHLGMELALPENALHWGLGLVALGVGFLVPDEAPAPAA